MRGLFLLLFALIGILSCEQNPEEELTESTTQYDTEDYKRMGDSITLYAQSVLVTNLMRAIGVDNFEYAVDYCNHHANLILDSVRTEDYAVRRISDKNRNPGNKASESEMRILQAFQKGSMDTVITDGDQTIYYRPIRIGMPICLKCHGKPEDLDPSAADKIKEHYPHDKATGYSNAELRGAWKVVFDK